MKKKFKGTQIGKRCLSVVFVIGFLSFIVIMDYPFIARLCNERAQGNVIIAQERAVKGADKERIREELQKAAAYNAGLASTGATLADAFQAVESKDKSYDSLLNLQGDGVMGVIEIPKLLLSLPVYHGTSEQVLQKGAGHLKGSSLPTGGADTHTCISAHRGLPDKEMFTNLDQLEEGDCFFIKIMGETLCYRIYQIETVKPDNTDSLSIVPGKDLATLITCTPYGLNTHRLYLHGERIPYEDVTENGKEAGTAGLLQMLRKYWWIPVTALLLVWMVYLLYLINRK